MLKALSTRLRQLSRVERLQALIGLALVLDTAILTAYSNLNIGVALPSFMGLGLLGLLWAKPCIQHWRATRPWFAHCWRLGQIACALWLASFVMFVTMLLNTTLTPLQQAPDYILVLGAGLHGDKPSLMLYNRLDTAFELAQRYPKARLIVSGGQGNREITSEALAMRNDLLVRGMADTRILQENQSHDTVENIAFTRALLEQRGESVTTQQIAIVTNDFHALRALRLAQHAGYTHCLVVPAPTPYSIMLNVWLREYLSWAKASLVGDI
ncbi:YdcF family protein [Uliginosibacterium gangwonense]|uniref:YdcF family protein n=1 Tax=Uliginosibacterium gangwonense TaxID=392736 RepID=UPI000367D24B|nr:YdcF family protein [Uliginosibacterium gangwonense]